MLVCLCQFNKIVATGNLKSDVLSRAESGPAVLADAVRGQKTEEKRKVLNVSSNRNIDEGIACI
jgi:hypothetical protein